MLVNAVFASIAARFTRPSGGPAWWLRILQAKRKRDASSTDQCHGSRLRWLSTWVLVVGATLLIGTPPASAQQIWFAMRGMEPDWKGVLGLQDWDSLFLRPHLNWPASLQNVSVIQVTTQTLRRISDDDLKKVVSRLNELKIALSVEMLAQAYTPDCGKNVEGYATPASTASIATKIKQAGGELGFAAMDEPLWFGHFYKGPSACHSSIADVARRVAANVNEYRRQFPALAVGDVEPIPALTAEDGWKETYRTWMSEFRSATGTPIAFLHLDIDWDHPGWRNSVPDIKHFADAQRLPFGIIYNASPKAKDDTEWLAHAFQHIREVEDGLATVPDQAIFQSWVRFPTHGIGDQSSPGEDHLVEQYQQWHARASAPGHRTGQ